MKLQKAQRDQVKLRLGISGASGFGKSYSALLLAYGITNDWTKIAIIDTENNSASLYSHLGDFNVLSLNEPYSPERYIEAIKTCENASMDVIIIDSITHEWQGKGGCLQIHEQLGGRFQDWAQVTPRHQAFIDAILGSSCHVITTVRSKIDYSIDTTSNGRTKVVKHGMKEITREGFEYELTVNFEIINDQHLVRASKDRTGLFSSDKPEFVINAATGKKILQWCNQSDKVKSEDVTKEISSCKTIEQLRYVYAKYPEIQDRIKPHIIQRQREIETLKTQVIPNQEIINQSKDQQNGTDNSTK
ncbi:AAA family ATPase [Mariniflexile maritimum]|uniref:AAA family ATPase n=1 Tax=Mariniflexile maritimum TaxID=2682493 RepID=UPI0012F6ACCF|nr:AAA family ATPase [Mariniflexile maritimum]